MFQQLPYKQKHYIRKKTKINNVVTLRFSKKLSRKFQSRPGKLGLIQVSATHPSLHRVSVNSNPKPNRSPNPSEGWVSSLPETGIDPHKLVPRVPGNEFVIRKLLVFPDTSWTYICSLFIQ